MSWLYSLVFAGLMFSAGSDVTVNNHRNAAIEQQPVVVSAADETEKFDQTYPLNPNGRVSVSNVNGSIVVEAWDRNEVKVEATKTADSKETLDQTQIRVSARPEAISIEVDLDAWKGESGWRNNRKIEVSFHLFVPRTAVLNEIATVNGSVTVSNFSNMTKISAVNGSVNASNLRGTANLSTVNGEVKADFDNLDAATKIALSTVNGKVSLLLPSDANATIKADSLNGTITNDFGLPVRKGQYVGRDLYGRVGSGVVQIKLNSVNGGLSVGRKNDGKSVNPATNLLPNKGSDGEDAWDNEVNENGVNMADVNREVARAVRESQVETAKAMRESRKALAVIPPVMPRIKIGELKDLEKLQVDIDQAKIAASVKEGIAAQQAALAGMNANWVVGAPVIEKKRNKFTIKGTPTVNINAKGCSVKVRGWDKPEVEYVVTEIAGRRDREPINVGEFHSDSEVTVKVINPNREVKNDLFYNRDRVRVEVFVPRNSNLKIDTDGEIRLDGVSGNIDLAGEDESINIRDVSGKLHIAAADGQIRVIGFKGEFDSETADGDLYLEGDFDRIRSKTGDGTIMLTLAQNSNAKLTANTVIETDGIALTRENDTTWQLGSGGAAFDFNVADGKVMIRSSDSLNAY